MNRLDNVLNINFSLYKFVKITAAYIYICVYITREKQECGNVCKCSVTYEFNVPKTCRLD